MVWSRLLTVLTVASAVAWAGDGDASPGKGETKLVRDGGKRFSIVLPAGWSIREAVPTDRRVSFEVSVPGASARAWLQISTPKSAACNPAGMPWQYWLSTLENDDVELFEIHHNVLPHVTYQYENGDKTSMRARAYPAPRGRVLFVTLIAAPGDFKQFYEPFLRAALTTTVNKPPWPEIPKPYRAVKKKRFVFATHEKVKPSIKHVMATTAALSKRFRKFHGPFPKLARGVPGPIIFIHTGNTQAKSLYTAIEGNRVNHWPCRSGMRFFTVAVQPDDQVESANLVYALAQFLLYQRYGTALPRWTVRGEGRAAMMEYVTKRKLPEMHAGHENWKYNLTLPRLDRMTPEIVGKDDEAFRRQSFFYVAFFRCGPSSYRKAYRAMLQDIAEQHHPLAALERHLEPIGYDKIQAAATKFMDEKIKFRTPK